jgi:hypothetical protein
MIPTGFPQHQMRKNYYLKRYHTDIKKGKDSSAV